MVGRSVLVACCLLAAAAVLHSAAAIEPVPVRQPLAAMPMQIGNWQGQPGPDIGEAAANLLGVDETLSRIYSHDVSPPVALFVGYYKSQRQGDSIHSPLNCLPGNGWEPASSRRLSFAVRNDESSAPHAITVNRIVIEKGMDRNLVLYWYQSQGRVTASEYWGRVQMVVDAIRSRRTDAALVRVMVPIPPGNNQEEASEQTAVSFVQSVFPLLGNFLPR